MYICEFPNVHLRFSECTLRKSWMRTQEFLSAHLENSECALGIFGMRIRKTDSSIRNLDSGGDGLQP